MERRAGPSRGIGLAAAAAIAAGLVAVANLQSTHAAQVLPSAPGWQERPAVVFGDPNTLAVWADQRFSLSVAGTRVSPGGVVLDVEEIRIAVAPGAQFAPDAGFDGQNYLVAWADERSGGRDVYAARVAPDGTLLDPSGFPVSTGGCCRFTPAIAFGGGQYFLVWANPGPQTEIFGA